MSFAKNAADLLTSPEADQARDEDRGRWRKYLATGAGLAGLAGAGYLASKNWGSIAPAINRAFGTVPEKGAVERGLNGVGVPMNGTAAGAIGLPAFNEARRMFANKGDSVAGLAHASRTAPAGSPMRRNLDDLKAKLDMTPVGPTGTPTPKAEASTLHSALEPVMNAGTDKRELVDIHNLGAKSLGRQAITKFTNPNDRGQLDLPGRLYDKYWSSRRQLRSLQTGLDQVAQAPTDPTHAPMIQGLQRTFGGEAGDPARLRQTIENLRTQSTSPRSLGARLAGSSALGALGGYMTDAMTKKPVP